MNKVKIPTIKGCRGLLALVLLATGCQSYQVGTESLFPPDIATVYVPMFESSSFRRYLGERLTEAVVKRIESTTPYKVVSGDHADSVLSGRIIDESKRIVVQTNTDEGRQIQTEMAVEVNWVDRRGDLIRQTQAIQLSPEILNLTAVTSLVPEAGQSISVAQQEAINQLAAQIVSMMETPW
jgi:hypothetical protein